MSQTSPYQPALLRLLHGISSVLVVLALITGFWVYNTYDKRWGSVALPELGDIQGIHGTIALTFLLLLPFFAFYSLRIGYRRLIQEQSLNQLQQVGKPVWWVALHRLANTVMLLAATFAVITGRMMKEEWLPAGEVDRRWYLAHLIAWLCLLISVAFHLLLGAKVGGAPLLLSMYRWGARADDTPRSWLRGWQTKHASAIGRMLEIVVIGGIVVAFLLPAVEYVVP